MSEHIFTNSIDQHPHNFFPTASMHGLHRTQERLRVNRSKALDRIQKAWDSGRGIEDLRNARQRKYVHDRSVKYAATGSIYRLMGDQLYIFDPQGCLITMFAMPRATRKSQNRYIGKKKYRNFGQYRQRLTELDYDKDDLM